MKFTDKPLVNYTQLLRIIGLLMIFEGMFLAVPAITCLCYGEADWLPFAATALLTASIGALLMSRLHPQTSHMGKRDGFLLTAMVWIVFSIFGMIPFLCCSSPLSLSDAFFEAMSGFTTTGASVIGHDSGLSHGVRLWQALMQWIGGMGIILFTLAVVPMFNHSGGIQMFNAEVTGITHDKIRPRISQTAKSLWSVYLALTLILVALLISGPMDVFDSVCHAFGAISTGGYANDALLASDNDNSSIYVEIVITIFMFLGGVNFALIYKAVRGDIKSVRQNDTFRTYIYVIIGCTILFSISAFASDIQSWRSIIVDPLFQVVSTITSTGYSDDGCQLRSPFILALTLIMMFSGACAGSTAGGAKIDRMIIVFKNCRNEIYRCIHPRAVMSVRSNGRVISSEITGKVMAFICIYIVIIICGGTALAALGVAAPEAFFSAFSCMTNTGFDAIACGGNASYAILPDAAKWTLALLMLVGRLEVFTVIVLFAPAFWHK